MHQRSGEREEGNNANEALQIMHDKSSQYNKQGNIDINAPGHRSKPPVDPSVQRNNTPKPQKATEVLNAAYNVVKMRGLYSTEIMPNGVYCNISFAKGLATEIRKKINETFDTDLDLFDRVKISISLQLSYKQLRVFFIRIYGKYDNTISIFNYALSSKSNGEPLYGIIQRQHSQKWRVVPAVMTANQIKRKYNINHEYLPKSPRQLEHGFVPNIDSFEMVDWCRVNQVGRNQDDLDPINELKYDIETWVKGCEKSMAKYNLAPIPIAVMENKNYHIELVQIICLKESVFVGISFEDMDVFNYNKAMVITAGFSLVHYESLPDDINGLIFAYHYMKYKVRAIYLDMMELHKRHYRLTRQENKEILQRKNLVKVSAIAFK